MKHPLISIVCLSFNRPQLLQRALESIREQTLPAMEILVVDNLSEQSDEIAKVVDGFHGIKLMAMSANIGYTGAMNAGLKASSGDYIVITEDDIILHRDAVKKVIMRLQSNPKIGFASGLMLNEKSGTIRCAGGRITLGTRFSLQVIGENESDFGQYIAPYEVNYLPGAFIIAHRRAWEYLGGFFEKYFAYMEDVDLCIRAQSAGLTLELVPEARLWHVDPPITSFIPEWLKLLKCQNLFRVYLLNAHLSVLPGFFIRYGVWELMKAFFVDAENALRLISALVLTFLELPTLLRDRRRNYTFQHFSND